MLFYIYEFPKSLKKLILFIFRYSIYLLKMTRKYNNKLSQRIKINQICGCNSIKNGPNNHFQLLKVKIV